MKTEEGHWSRKNTKRVVAAAVALFLAGAIWNRYGGFCLRTVNAWFTGAVLGAIAITDGKTMKIPNRLTVLLLIPVVISFAAEPEITILNRGAGFLAVSLPMVVMNLAVPGSFGGGDIKLMAVCGLLLGVPRILCTAFLAVITGGSYAVWLLAAKKAGRREHFAFGPFLAAGIMVSMLYGTALLTWYYSFIAG